jgi:hypothetical protein
MSMQNSSELLTRDSIGGLVLKNRMIRAGCGELESSPGGALRIFEVAQDPPHLGGIGDDRDELHLGSTQRKSSGLSPSASQPAARYRRTIRERVSTRAPPASISTSFSRRAPPRSGW